MGRVNRDLGDWTKELISIVRDESKKILKEGKYNLLSTLDQPCQIEVFWLKHQLSNVDLQIFFFTHFVNMDDLNILIHGPVEANKVVKLAEGMLKESKWKRKLPSTGWSGLVGKDRTYAKAIEKSLNSCMKSFKRRISQTVFGSISFPVGGGGFFSPNLIRIAFHGDVRDGNIKEIAKDIANSLRRDKQSKKKIIVFPKTNGYTSYLYPPVWIGKLPSWTLHQRLLGSSYPLEIQNETCLFLRDNIRIGFAKDGLIWIECTNKSSAIQFLNLVIGMISLLGFSFIALEEAQIREVVIEWNIQKPMLPRSLSWPGAQFDDPRMMLASMIGREAPSRIRELERY